MAPAASTTSRPMRHQKTRNKLSRDTAHRKALLMNLSKEIIEHERIKTTEAKAKAVKPEIEKLITLAKRGDLHARRQALSTLSQDKFAVHKLFDEVGAPLRRAPRRLHAHPQARSASQRRDRDGLHRARLSALAAPRARRGMATKLTIEYDGTGFAGWARQPGKRTVQEELERALQTVLGEQRPGRRAAAPDGRRAHRPRRARVGAGGELRARGGRPAAPQRPARRRRGGARRRAGADGFDARRDATQPHLLLPRARAAHAQRVRARARVLVAAARSTATRCRSAPRALVGQARLHRVHADARPSTRWFHCRRASRASGATTATCSSSGSRPTCSCAT